MVKTLRFFFLAGWRSIILIADHQETGRLIVKVPLTQCFKSIFAPNHANGILGNDHTDQKCDFRCIAKHGSLQGSRCWRRKQHLVDSKEEQTQESNPNARGNVANYPCPMLLNVTTAQHRMPCPSGRVGEPHGETYDHRFVGKAHWWQVREKVFKKQPLAEDDGHSNRAQDGAEEKDVTQ